MPLFLQLFLSGILFGSGPCMASCGPVIVPFISGSAKSVKHGLLVYFAFSIARISAYLTLSFLVYSIGRTAVGILAQSINHWVIVILGAVIVAVGALMLMGIDTHLPHARWLRALSVREGYSSMIVVGFLLGLLPCAPLMAMFSYTGLIAHSWLQSILLSLSFGLGTMASAMFIVALGAGFIPRILPRNNEQYKKLFRILCGLIMIAAGIQLMWKRL